MTIRLQEVDQAVEDMLNAGYTDTNYDEERDRAYDRALQIHRQLNDMQSTLSDVVERLNTSSQAVNDSSNPVNQVVKILNVHYDALNWIKKSTDNLRTDSKLSYISLNIWIP